MSVKDLSAYELVKEEDLKGIKSHGMLLKHKKSGARILLIEMMMTTRYLISDSVHRRQTVPEYHISWNIPYCVDRRISRSKDPFVELVKGSLNTFLNAMTYPDKTVYPVASCNDKDFQNLMHVYMDAVFYPNIYQHEEISVRKAGSYKMDSERKMIWLTTVLYTMR